MEASRSIVRGVDMGSILMRSPLGHDVNSMSLARKSSEPSKISELTPVVFIVGADGAAGESLAPLIRSAGWLSETFTTAEEFLARSPKPVPSCLILDVSDPGDGLELQKRLAAERPHIPIIFLSNKADVTATVKAIKAGAVEFFTKPFQAEDLLSAIRDAHERSRSALDYEAEQRLLRESYGSLSHRERQVMVLVASGLLNKQVAGELGITEATVKAHRGQVMQKMKAISYPDLVKRAARLGLAGDLLMPALLRDAHRAPNLVAQLFGSCASAPLETGSSV
jgi:FixJ family two-component response regulator